MSAEPVDLASEHSLTREIQTYEARKAELLREAAGKYVLIRGEEVAGTFDDQMAAVRFGVRTYGVVPFLVRRIEEVESPIYLLSPSQGA